MHLKRLYLKRLYLKKKRDMIRCGQYMARAKHREALEHIFRQWHASCELMAEQRFQLEFDVLPETDRRPEVWSRIENIVATMPNDAGRPLKVRLVVKKVHRRFGSIATHVSCGHC